MGTKMDLHSEEYLSMLMRRQFGLAVGIASVFVVLVASIPLLNRFLPDTMNAPFMGFTVTWLLLGLAIFPTLIGLAYLFVHRSNDFEDEAIGMVDSATLPTRVGATPPGTTPAGPDR
jgi:uncharacterized membrane protein (DUF485 family)